VAAATMPAGAPSHVPGLMPAGSAAERGRRPNSGDGSELTTCPGAAQCMMLSLRRVDSRLMNDDELGFAFWLALQTNHTNDLL